MATIPEPTEATLPVAGGSIDAGPLNGWITNIKAFIESKNITESNVDTSSSNGIVGMSLAQTITGAKTFTAPVTASGGGTLTGSWTIADLTITTVDINGGTIDDVVIGGSTAVAGSFTDLTATGTSTLTTVDINGGAIDGTTVGATSASTGAFTTLDASGNATVGGTLGVTGALTASGGVDGVVGGVTPAAGTFTDLTATGTSTLSTVDINAGAIDGTTIGASSAAAGSFTTLAASGNATIGGTLGVTGAATFSNHVIVNGPTSDATNTYYNSYNIKLWGHRWDGSQDRADEMSLVLVKNSATDDDQQLEVRSEDGTAIAKFYDNTNVAIQPLAKLYLDGGSNTYLTESSGDVLDIYTGGSIAQRIDASQQAIFYGNVGIGTTSPFGKVHIQTTSSGASAAHTSAADLVIENSLNAGLTIFAGNTVNSNIFFGDAEDNDIGRIQYSHSSNSLGFMTNTATRMTIDSSGNVDISSGNLTTGSNKGYDIGESATAWDDVYADDFQNVADFYFLDDRDDLAAIMNIKPSGEIDPATGIALIDDDSLPEWALSKHTKDIVKRITDDNGEECDHIICKAGDVMRTSDGDPYLSMKLMTSWNQGAIRQLNTKVEENYAGMIGYMEGYLKLKKEVSALKRKLTILTNKTEEK